MGSNWPRTTRDSYPAWSAWETIDPSRNPAPPGRTLTPPDFGGMRLTWDSLLEQSKSWGPNSRWRENAEAFLKNNFEVQPDGYVLPRLRFDKHMLIVRALWDQKVSRLFPGILCPVLLMPARQSVPSESERSWQETKEIEVQGASKLIPNTRVVWMEDSVHDVPVQRPVEVAQAIKDAVSEGFFG